MQTSRKKLGSKTKVQIRKLLFQTISDLKNSEEVELFFDDLLSAVEVEVLAKRLAIAYRLEKGESYDKIRSELQTSSTTVAMMADQLKNSQGLQLALTKIKAEEWAEKWASRIEKLFGEKARG